METPAVQGTKIQDLEGFEEVKRENDSLSGKVTEYELSLKRD